MRRYYFRIFHKGETHADDVGELFGSAELGIKYGVSLGTSPVIPNMTVVRARS